MRDILSDFGTAKVTTADTAVAFPNGVDAGDGGNIGRLCELFISCYIEGSTAVPAAEVIQFDLLDADTTGAGTVVGSYVRPAGALAVGDHFSFKIPVKDHKRYLSLQVTADTTANLTFHCFLEEGEGK